MYKSWIYILAVATSAGFLLVGATEQASALCKPGDPHCIKAGRTNITRFKNTVGNAGDCVGTTNDTCGYHTGMARTVSHSPISHPTSTGSHK